LYRLSFLYLCNPVYKIIVVTNFVKYHPYSNAEPILISHLLLDADAVVVAAVIDTVVGGAAAVVVTTARYQCCCSSIVNNVVVAATVVVATADINAVVALLFIRL
jgi:hypothetical protein